MCVKISSSSDDRCVHGQSVERPTFVKPSKGLKYLRQGKSYHENRCVKQGNVNLQQHTSVLIMKYIYIYIYADFLLVIV